MATMTRAEQDLQMMADLYEARRAARFLLRDNYVETLKPYRDFIARVMADEQLPVLRAALKIGKALPLSEPIPLMCVLAAAVEMMETQATTEPSTGAERANPHGLNDQSEEEKQTVRPPAEDRSRG